MNRSTVFFRVKNGKFLGFCNLIEIKITADKSEVAMFKIESGTETDFFGAVAFDKGAGIKEISYHRWRSRSSMTKRERE